MAPLPKVNDKVRVQDDRREVQLAKLLDLIPRTARAGHDAEDSDGNHYELKTTTMAGFGTARDVSRSMIDIWRTRYWICAKGRNLASGYEFDEIYFLSPSMLNGWFKNMEQKFEPDEAIRDKALPKLKDTLTKKELKRLKYLIDRGMTYNNPKIPLNYVRKNGISLDIRNAASELKKLVRENREK
jgi:hypothetical protein